MPSDSKPNADKEAQKVYWFTNSVDEKAYDTTTWYRCVGLAEFMDVVEKTHKPVALIVSGNNIGFILDKRGGKQ